MRVIFTKRVVSEYESWVKSQKRIAIKIDNLVEDILLYPTTAVGHPELLKGYQNYWSRRITKGDRLAYKLEESINDKNENFQAHAVIYRYDETDQSIILISCKYHCDDH